MQFPASDQ